MLTRVNTPSDKAPNGSRGHRVILTREAAEDALWSLEGMAVGFKVGWDGHDARQKCGVITEAYLDGDAVCVRGYIFARDFPEVQLEMAKPEHGLGMSYEMADAYVEDMRTKVWKLIKVTFTGAAILLRDRAAYRETKVNLSAAAASASGVMKIQGRIGKVRLASKGQ